MPDNKALKREAMAEIRAVEEILRRWDPIGVIPSLLENELPPDEYDGYAPYIVGMLRRGSGLEDLSSHLNHCRTGAMGLPPNPAADRQVAGELLAWWQGQLRP